MVFPRWADRLGVRMDQLGRTLHWRVGWVWRANGDFAVSHRRVDVSAPFGLNEYG